MRFSVICSTWNRPDYRRWVEPVVRQLSDDVVEVATASNLMAAYNRGTMMARHRVKVYIHDDLEILEPRRFVEQLEEAFSDPAVGMVGAIGSTTLNRLPWWHEPEIVGMIRHGRNEGLVSEYGNPIEGPVEVAAVDGIVYATREDLWLPEEMYRGFHMYDMEASRLMAAKGKVIAVVPWKIHHHARRKRKRDLPDFVGAAQLFSRRYGIPISEQDWNWIDEDDLARKPALWWQGRPVTREEAVRLVEEDEERILREEAAHA